MLALITIILGIVICSAIIGFSLKLFKFNKWTKMLGTISIFLGLAIGIAVIGFAIKLFDLRSSR